MIPPQILKELEYWIKTQKFGNIQINFNKGRIVNYNLQESKLISKVHTTESHNESLDSTANQPPKA